MSETRAVVLETQVNTTGARAGFNEIVREAGTMAGSVQRASQQADRAVDGIGGSASTSAKKVADAQRSLINSIQRTTAAMEAGGKSGSAYYETLARQRGVDPAALDAYLVQLRAVERAQAQSAQTLTAQQAAQQRATEAAQAQAAAQRELAQAQATRDSFVAGLREQIALFGKSTDEVLRYRAAQAGAAQESSALILQLQNMTAAQNQVTEAARATERAQQEAMRVQAGKDSFLAGLREQIALFGLSTEEVQRYKAAQLGVASSADPMIAQLNAMRVAQERVTTAARATAQAQREAEQVQAGKDSFIRSLEQQANAIGKSRHELLELQAAQMGVTSRAQPFINQLRAADQGLRDGGMSAGALNAALRQTPAQLTDVIVSLQGGQAPLTVLLQQGGQLRDMFGSVGGAARALGGAVLKLINPYSVVAAAAGTLLYAHKVGHDEMVTYTRALVMTGNAAGVTTGQMGDMASQVAKVTGSQRGAAEALAELAGTGAIAGSNLAEFGTVAIEAQRVLGKSVSETAGEFAKLGKSPLSGLREIADKYRFITAETYAQVKAAQEQGRTLDAVNIAQHAYANGINGQKQKVLDSLSSWERAWIKIKTATSGAADSVVDFAGGREVSDTEKTNKLLAEQEGMRSRIARLKRQGALRDGEKYDSSKDRDVLAAEAALELNQRTITSIQAQGKAKEQAATGEAAAGRATALRNNWLDESNILLTRQQTLERDLQAARTEGQANGLSEEEIQNRLLVIRRKYNDVYTAGIEASITALRRRDEIEGIRDQRALDLIAAKRALGSISEDDAIKSTAQVQLAALDRQKKMLQGQLDKIRGQVNSEGRQVDLRGQIDAIPEQYKSRENQRDNDLALARQKRADDSAALYRAGIVAAEAERDSLQKSVKAQQEYNEEIGLSNDEVAKLRATRAEDVASLKEQTAAFAAAEKGGSAVAQIYRDQAAAIRAGSAAEREGFTKSRDPYVNLRMSLKRYGEEAQNVGGMVGDALTNGLRSAEDAFANFVTTGKLNFRDLATSIIADFARIQAKSALSGVASSLLGSIGSGGSGGDWTSSLMQAFGVSGARAAGGPVNSGLSYLVGEKGPEIFTPSSSGAITPNHMLGAGGGQAVNVSFNTTINGEKSSTQSTNNAGATSRAAMDALHGSFKQWLAAEMRQGGAIWAIKNGR